MKNENTVEKVWLACVQRYLLNHGLVEPTVQENVASSVSVEKKQFVVHRSKKNSDCANITKIKDEKIQIF